ncbi:MAG: DUF1640 domain-containing protein [Methylobacter sp.]
MATITFDTHDFFKKLKSAGFSEEQAEVLTELQKITVLNILEQARHDYKRSNLATQHDLIEERNNIKSGFNSRFDGIERELKLNQWILGIILVTSLLVMLK